MTAAGIQVGQFIRRKALQVQDCGVQVAEVRLSFNGLGSGLVCLAMNVSTFRAASPIWRPSARSRPANSILRYRVNRLTRDRLPVIDHGSGMPVKIADQRLGGVDSQVVINRGQEVARTADPLDRVLAAFVRVSITQREIFCRSGNCLQCDDCSAGKRKTKCTQAEATRAAGARSRAGFAPPSAASGRCRRRD